MSDNLPPLPPHPEHAWLWTEAEKMMIRAYAAQAVAERDAEIASLREANERFGRRQEWWTEKMFQLEADAAQAVAAEREACADICDQHASAEGIAQRCAAAIRARGQKESPPV